MSKFDNFQFPQGGFPLNDENGPDAAQTPLGNVSERFEQALPWEPADDDCYDPGGPGRQTSPSVSHTGTPQPNQRSKGGVHTGHLPPHYA